LKEGRKMKHLLIIAFILLNIFGCDENPVKPENGKPVITSLIIFPDVVGPSDSAIIVISAFDPDGDTLVYDWETDSRVKLHGAIGSATWLYNAHENFQVIYPTGYNNQDIDTLWVQCYARDGKGKSDSKVIRFIYNKIGGEAH
jgi:hypothetical protein